MPCPHRFTSGVTTRHAKLLGYEIPWVETLIFIHKILAAAGDACWNFDA